MNNQINFLRSLACFLVILMHTSGPNFYNSWGDKYWWAANFFNSFTHVCIPLFFMISGSLLLGKEEPLGAYFKKRILRIVPPLVFWGLFYLLYLQHNGKMVNWGNDMLASPPMYHLWYLYAILGFYAFLPVIRKFVLYSRLSEVWWFIATWFIVGSVWPTALSLYSDTQCGFNRLGMLSNIYHLEYFGGYLGYFVLGFGLSKLKGNFKTGMLAYVSLSILTMALVYMQSKKIGVPCQFFNEYLSPLTVLSAAALFWGTMSMEIENARFWKKISDATLGIYCVHVVVIGGLFELFQFTARRGNPWFSTPLVAISAFIICFFSIYILRLIKPFRVVL